MSKYSIITKFFPDGIQEGSKDAQIAEKIFNAIKFNDGDEWELLARHFAELHQEDKYQYCNHMADVLQKKEKQQNAL